MRSRVIAATAALLLAGAVFVSPSAHAAAAITYEQSLAMFGKPYSAAGIASGNVGGL